MQLNSLLFIQQQWCHCQLCSLLRHIDGTALDLIAAQHVQPVQPVHVPPSPCYIPCYINFPPVVAAAVSDPIRHMTACHIYFASSLAIFVLSRHFVPYQLSYLAHDIENDRSSYSWVLHP